MKLAVRVENALPPLERSAPLAALAKAATPASTVSRPQAVRAFDGLEARQRRRPVHAQEAERAALRVDDGDVRGEADAGRARRRLRQDARDLVRGERLVGRARARRARGEQGGDAGDQQGPMPGSVETTLSGDRSLRVLGASADSSRSARAPSTAGVTPRAARRRAVRS